MENIENGQFTYWQAHPDRPDDFEEVDEAMVRAFIVGPSEDRDKAMEKLRRNGFFQSSILHVAYLYRAERTVA